MPGDEQYAGPLAASGLSDASPLWGRATQTAGGAHSTATTPAATTTDAAGRGTPLLPTLPAASVLLDTPAIGRYPSGAETAIRRRVGIDAGSATC